MAKGLIIEKASRTQAGHSDDVLEFTLGVNVVVGAPNTGKTGWLRIINYVLGSDEKTEEAIGAELATKYDTAEVVIRVDGTQHKLQRRWKEPGAKTKVFVDGEPMSSDEVSHFLMNQMDIPILHYPQGNPLGQRTWPELSWRSLFRHMYRRQRFWSDLADQQPESEQHACILQFSGLAQYLYSDQYGSLVEKQKRILELQARKEHFVEMLQEVSKDLLDDSTVGVGLTPESLTAAVASSENRIAEAATQRDELLRSLAAAASAKTHTGSDTYERLSEQLARLRSQEEKIEQQLRRAEDRLSEIGKYQKAIENEASRLQRARSAGGVFADLKVTHCPACDQEINTRLSNSEACYVCGQSVPTGSSTPENADKRLEFEIEQLDAERKEAAQLIDALKGERDESVVELTKTKEAIRRIQQAIRPVQSVAAQILPPGVAVLDMEVGRLQERIRQLQRIQATLAKRMEINQQIEVIQAEVSVLEGEVATQAAKLDFDQASDELTDGINNYLNAIKQLNPRSWTLDAPMNVKLREKGFKITVGGENWKSKLGGTLTLYFVLAYQYALMQLRTRPNRNHPGLVLLDFPAQLEDGTSVADKENFVLEPFLGLCEQLAPDAGQVIGMGSAFENFAAATRIELTTVWQ